MFVRAHNSSSCVLSLSLPQWDVDVPTLESVSHTYTQYLSRNTFFFIITEFNRRSFYYFSGCWSNFVISLSLSLSHHLSSGLFTLPHKCFVIRQTGSNKFERARSSEQNVFSRTTPYTVYSVYYTQTHTHTHHSATVGDFYDHLLGWFTSIIVTSDEYWLYG